MNRVEATRELRRKTEEAVNEKVTHVALTVEMAQALLAVLAPEGEVSVGDRVSIPDDGGDDGTETGVMEDKTKEQMEALAKEMFGEEAEVYYADNQWVISTGVEESFDLEAHKDREAYKRYHEMDGGENSLLRWARKNGHGGESLADLFDSYDAEMEATSRMIVQEVREKVAAGFTFDWEGGAEWRDEVLAYAEEKGW